MALLTFKWLSSFGIQENEKEIKGAFRKYFGEIDEHMVAYLQMHIKTTNIMENPSLLMKHDKLHTLKIFFHNCS